MNEPLIAVAAAGVLALIFAFWRARVVARADAGTDEMIEIAGYIREGAMAFLNREYRVLAIFVLVVAGLLAAVNLPRGTSLVAVSFMVGAVCSGLAGFFGMRVATLANVRTAAAARHSIARALDVAFTGGSVMGMCVVGLGVLGLSGLFLIYVNTIGSDVTSVTGKVLAILSGFSLGASSIALFARVGGGIYTKAADIGADLVGKLEAGIPEDDPRNPASIADAVGDNVGDVAGMGADLFESYVGAIIGAMILGVPYATSLGAAEPLNYVVLPLVLAGLGIVVSILATFLVRTSEDGNPQVALNLGVFGSAILMLPVAYFAIDYFADQGALNILGAMVLGLSGGVGIALATEYYTASGRGPVNAIAASSLTGTATNIIAGLGIGMQSTTIPIMVIAGALVGAHELAGLYGIAMAGLGMLCTVGVQLAVDAYGPIADNAGGIAEMSHLPPEVRARTDQLDAVGNTTAAIGKGFAIGSAALTALALFSAFRTQAQLERLDLLNPIVMAGVFVGGMIPFLFSSMAMKAVGDAAGEMIEEVRRQFREIPGLMEGTAKADYRRCVDISTSAAIRRMVVPGLLAVTVPVVTGFIGKEALGGLLAGVTVSGVLLALFMSNAGGAWDNAKKAIEAGEHGGKGSEAHKAAVVGDTVGDPFKDTAGPSLNILIKLMAIVAVVIAPLLV
ncbi:MAG: sodium-translocating pyrophosphatase [Deltaproteobacteria bacterium]|nr:sodium-translocating pyrophosphatase [Deltaproteobacteria bacterium]MCZ6713619.1 sodium-translocating pyrophosphatase [Deltaproteobacteria bacterium]MCZ6822406.1 sodium-translocating pyrophosphatase [Deltaproteobacteria bacterium]